MYQVTNLESQDTRGFESRDALLQFLDEQNAVCRQEQMQLDLKLLHVDHDTGEVKSNLSITLPTSGTIDSLLMTFGKDEGKKKLPLPFPKRAPKEIPKSPPEKLEGNPEEPAKVNQEVVSEKQLETLFKQELLAANRQSQRVARFLFGLIFMLGAASIGLGILQSTQIKQLKEDIKILNSSQNQEASNLDHKLNVFSRYFLSHYYSVADRDLSDFVSKSLTKEVKSSETSLISAILEEVKSTKAGYNVSFVLALRSNNETRNVRLVFTVKADKSSPYGYRIIKAPVETPYLNQ
ncbi:hypothetical protein [Streptococcus ovuberis]|uniref:Uncharacterized protein n=1 Tax=Streptococcus ovuberis TaxID=1936207 RepID=A0A7X6MWJ1_9STRE|nr:hypothetical protein [Streptococcus ovuberis]NKZ19692.1 hypothetical protein [Streptococcus ovuberis]